VDHHKALIADEGTYAQLRTILAEVGSTDHHVIHIPFSPDPIPQLDTAPTTEFVFFKAKSGKQPELKAAIGEITQSVNGLKEGYGFGYGASYGITVEDENEIVFVMGWESVEAHLKQVAESEEAKKKQAELELLADAELAHVNLTRYH